ncbi:hypothetical protein ABZ820_05585 [Streptomyces diacarni]|uniref:Uncharacterized protein n=1 Tax=Streptomyces diacarni TaxID=2800381 RepID=A0A367ETD8_9ACTN|nr:hypothetical protein [Streptomyces diacarni]RCG20845.1 hypothetical protein DTL70_21515 [Streptomyces diacarni]
MRGRGHLSPAPHPRPRPCPHTVGALITRLAVYPTITVTPGLIGPAMAGIPLPLRALALTAVVVPVSAYALLPALNRLAARVLRS